jgi:hypothetical protein
MDKRLTSLHKVDFAVIVTMVGVAEVQPVTHQVIDVIPVRDRFVCTASGVSARAFDVGTISGIFSAHGN